MPAFWNSRWIAIDSEIILRVRSVLSTRFRSKRVRTAAGNIPQRFDSASQSRKYKAIPLRSSQRSNLSHSFTLRFKSVCFCQVNESQTASSTARRASSSLRSGLDAWLVLGKGAGSHAHRFAECARASAGEKDVPPLFIPSSLPASECSANAISPREWFRPSCEEGEHCFEDSWLLCSTVSWPCKAIVTILSSECPGQSTVWTLKSCARARADRHPDASRGCSFVAGTYHSL